MKIYIAGPITGIIDYKQKFMAAEEKVKEMGHIAINPAYLPEGLRDYMGICKAMIDQADAIILLDGWEDSKGSCEELTYAHDKGIKPYQGVDIWK